MRRLLVCYAAAVASFLVAAWWIYPFINLKTNPAFNSDSALVLEAATQRLPFAENLFQWGSARNGSLLAVMGKIFYRLFGSEHLLAFIGIVDALLFSVGCSAFVAANLTGRRFFLAVPAGLLLVLPNFHTGITVGTFAFTVTDVAHRPEGVPVLVILSWIMLSLAEQKLWTGRWWWRFGCALLLAIAAGWVTEVAVTAILMLVGLSFCRAIVLRMRYPVETTAIWLCGLVGVQALRAISVYGSAENQQLYKLVNRDVFRRLFSTAVLSACETISPITWVVIGAGLATIVVLAVWRPRLAFMLVRARTSWQTINLFGVGMLTLLLPFGSDWVFGNSAHPRYFSPASLLLCIATAQGAVALLERPLPRWRRLVTAAAVVTIVILPASATGIQTAILRQDLEAINESVCHQASRLLAETEARAIIGPFWDSYVYVVAAPGKMKVTATDDLKTSRTNTLRVLRSAPVAWIDRKAAKLKPVMHSRGVEFIGTGDTPPAALPGNAFFKLYIPSGNGRIECGLGEYQVYFKHGWRRDLTNAAYPRLWASGKRASIELPLQRQLSYRLTIAGVTAKPEPKQNITVISEGVTLGHTTSDAGQRIAAVVTVPPTIKSGIRIVEFEINEDSQAGRDLSAAPAESAVAFEVITFSALP